MSGTLFVRSGGGMPGLDVHAGIWLALEEAGIRPTECAGTSAGAVVSAIQAAGRDARFFASVVESLRDSDVRRERLLWKLRIPWIDWFLSPSPIAGILRRLLPQTSFADLPLPFAAWATRLSDSAAINVARPELSASVAEAVLASMAISGVFPPLRLLDGEYYQDGGTRKNLPLPANWRDYDSVWLLIASGRPAAYVRRGGLLTALFRSVHQLAYDQLSDVLEATAAAPNVHVIWPRLDTPAGMLHFDHRLIEAAYLNAKATIRKLSL